MEEREAVRRCQKGERTAFRLLVEKYGDLAFRTAYLMTRDRGLAEDVVQESFLACWRGLAKFDARQPLRPWLLRIVVNCCLSRRRRPTVATVPLEHSGVALLADPDPLPEEMAVRQDTRQLLREAIASLEEGQRLVVMLRYFADLSLAEIAGILACPEGTVKSRLHRALSQLRAQLAADRRLPMEPLSPR